MYKITLSDGTELENLRLNGNNFISSELVTADLFDGKLGTVTFTGPEGTETYHDLLLVQITREGNDWWFVLTEKTEAQKQEERVAAMEAAMASMWDQMAAAYREGVQNA